MNIYSLTDIEIRKRIGDRLRAVRLRQNITQSALASDAQVSLSTLKKIEAGEIGSFDSFIRVVRILGKLEDLIPFVEDEEMSPNEYYEFVTSLKKRTRRRAAKSLKQTEHKEELEW